MSSYGIQGKVLLAYLFFLRCSGVYLVTRTLEDGVQMVTCAGDDIYDILWTVWFPRRNYPLHLDFDDIKSSAIAPYQVMHGTTLSSELTEDNFTWAWTVQSKMTVNPSSLNQGGDIYFTCSGETIDNRFENNAVINVVPIQPTTEQPATSPPSESVTMPQESPDPTVPSIPKDINNSASPPTTLTDISGISPSPDHPQETTEISIPVGAWIALAVVTLLILTLLVLTIILSVLTYKYKKKKREDLPETLHHYDYISTRGSIYSTPATTQTPDDCATQLAPGDQSGRESQYIDMAPNASYARVNQVNEEYINIANLGSQPSRQYNMKINTAYKRENDM